MNRIANLRQAFDALFVTWQAAMQDPRCHDVADWVVRSIMQPNDPGAVPVPVPGGPGGEVVDVLCTRFGC